MKDAIESQIAQKREIERQSREIEGLKKTHAEYAEKVEKLHAEDVAKLRRENSDLRRALEEMMPVLRRLLDWRISHPLA